MQSPPDLIVFLGRFHPVIVHLPIGILLATAILELVAWFPRFQKANASAGFLIALAAPAAVAAAACGWFLSLAGGYDAVLLSWHKWLGLATAAGSVTAVIFFWRGKFNAYRVTLFLATGMLMAAGHLGGSLTHGSDYLLKYAPAPLKKLLRPDEGNPLSIPAAGDRLQIPVFAGVIAPILEIKCVECHGPAKSKGDLRLDTFAAVMKGGQDGAVVQPGNALQSPLAQRVLLPVEHDDHMPPDGKPPLTPGEIALLKWWIDAGAPETKTVAALQPSFEIQQLLQGNPPGR